jgi:hypothetical protein
MVVIQCFLQRCDICLLLLLLLLLVVTWVRNLMSSWPALGKLMTCSACALVSLLAVRCCWVG